jgi:hypothetical protein
LAATFDSRGGGVPGDVPPIRLPMLPLLEIHHHVSDCWAAPSLEFLKYYNVDVANMRADDPDRVTGKRPT